MNGPDHKVSMLQGGNPTDLKHPKEQGLTSADSMIQKISAKNAISIKMITLRTPSHQNPCTIVPLNYVKKGSKNKNPYKQSNKNINNNLMIKT